jgi:hypothetical protein
VKVKNINGTSSNTCKCGSWLKHWEKYSGEKAGLCNEKSCTNSATIGAHVQKLNSIDDSWYIVPLCNKHNNKRGEELELYKSPQLISANVRNTCG